MKVTVVAFNAAEAHQAKEGLAKLKKSVNEFKRDLRDSRMDLDTIESFVRELRMAADYFERFLEDESEEVQQDVPEFDIEAENQ